MLGNSGGGVWIAGDDVVGGVETAVEGGVCGRQRRKTNMDRGGNTKAHATKHVGVTAAEGETTWGKRQVVEKFEEIGREERDGGRTYSRLIDDAGVPRRGLEGRVVDAPPLQTLLYGGGRGSLSRRGRGMAA